MYICWQYLLSTSVLTIHFVSCRDLFPCSSLNLLIVSYFLSLWSISTWDRWKSLIKYLTCYISLWFQQFLLHIFFNFVSAYNFRDVNFSYHFVVYSHYPEKKFFCCDVNFDLYSFPDLSFSISLQIVFHYLSSCFLLHSCK